MREKNEGKEGEGDCLNDPATCSNRFLFFPQPASFAAPPADSHPFAAKQEIYPAAKPDKRAVIGQTRRKTPLCIKLA